ncbi:MAG: Asp23/Gls24 family envelope stress response protein [Lachnospiraceae bacterium]|nr:Asp23/Gls24 family envelope stress response protein [Lachnospiraceae bacterium]
MAAVKEKKVKAPKNTTEKSGISIGTSENNGHVFIADAVVEEIAALAASEVEGVEGISEKVKGRSLIKADIAGTNVKISMIISTRFGYPIPATCQAVQTRVKSSVENMTGLTCTDVNIRVSGVEI